MAPQVKPNITGFDPRRLIAASGSPANDPWRRAELWRSTGPFTRFNRFRSALPGLGTATVAFAAYCAYEYAFLSDESHGHGDSHGKDEQH